MLRKEKQWAPCEGEDRAQAKAGRLQRAGGKMDTPTRAGFMATMLRVFHPLLVYDAYTFRWLGFDPREHENTREQAFTKVTNVGLISALVFTVWASWLQVVADTSFDSYGESWADDIKGITSSFLCAGTFFLLFSVINSVLVLLAVNETEDDHQAMRLLHRLDLWFTLPSIYFYLGVASGSFGFLLWFPAAFPLKYAIFNIAAGLFIIAVNAPFYQFLILCVYDTRTEAGLQIPSPPAWHLSIFKLRHTSQPSETPLVKPSEVSPVIPMAGSGDNNAQASDAVMLLQKTLENIGQRALLPTLVDNGWDHVDALVDMKEQHVSECCNLKPGHIARFLRSLRHELEVYRGTGTAS